MGLSVIMVNAASYGRREQRSSEILCGDDINESISLICSDRGGSYAPLPNELTNPNSLRPGIVDDCCRSGCSPEQLEQYCMYKIDD